MTNKEINHLVERECPFNDGPPHRCRVCDQQWMILYWCFVAEWEEEREHHIEWAARTIKQLLGRSSTF